MAAPPEPTSILVQLRSSGASAPSGDVWFVPGAHAAAWLDELVHFGVDLTTTFVLPVPSSRADRTPLGAVVVLPIGVVPHRHHRATPWRRYGERWFVPADSELWPPLAEAELAQLAGERWLVWHPAAGLVAFAADERLPVAALLQVARDDAAWDRAVPGLVAVARLTSVSPERPPTVLELFASEQRTIGSQSPSELPPLPDEPPPKRILPSPRPLGTASLDLFARGLLHLFTDPNATRQATGWWQRVLQWASNRLGQRAATPTADQERRAREIRRLLELLDRDPERGLRHALPLGGPEGRGLAPPSNLLGERSPDFSLGALAGGGPVDSWHVDPETQRQLRQRYREIANAEIRRGNHRRAAYILAHLLGDLHAAAQCLRDGGQFREAATLYGERLGQHEQAAACLVAGGWLGEAAAVFERLGQWEKVGDLRLMQGQSEGAAEAYGREHSRRVATGDVLGAAMLRAEKLFDVPGALATLAEHARLAGDARSFAAWLALLQRTGGDEQVRRELQQRFVTGALPANVELRVVSAFAPRAKHPQLRALLRDRGRIALAHRLAQPGGMAADAMAVLRALPLSPNDAVLGRDLRQVMQALTKATKPQEKATSSSVVRGQLVRRWQRVGQFEGKGLCALFGGSIVCASSMGWAPGWRLQPLANGQSGRVIEAPPTMELRSAPGADALYGLAWDNEHVIGVWLRLDRDTAAGVTAVARGLDARALAPATDGTVWLATRGEVVARILERRDPDGRLLKDEVLPPYAAEGAETTSLHVVGDVVVCVRGNQVAVRTANGTWNVEPMHELVIGVAVSPEPGATCIGLAFERGFAVLDVARIHEGPACWHTIDVGMDAPILGWTRNGFLVAVDEKTAIVCRGGREVQRLHSEPFTHGRPHTILTLPAPDQLLFVAEQTITCYAVR